MNGKAIANAITLSMFLLATVFGHPAGAVNASCGVCSSNGMDCPASCPFMINLHTAQCNYVCIAQPITTTSTVITTTMSTSTTTVNYTRYQGEISGYSGDYNLNSSRSISQEYARDYVGTPPAYLPVPKSTSTVASTSTTSTSTSTAQSTTSTPTTVVPAKRPATRSVVDGFLSTVINDLRSVFGRA